MANLSIKHRNSTPVPTRLPVPCCDPPRPGRFRAPETTPTAYMERFDELFCLIRGRFAQTQSRNRAMAYLLGLLSNVTRKNSWQLAAFAGDESPDGMQRLLNHYVWSAHEVRDDLRAYIGDRLGNRAATLVVGETCFAKKGTLSAGVQRGHSHGTSRASACQVGMFLLYTSGGVSAFIDRELYLPQPWCADQSRARRAGIPDEVSFRSKSELTKAMISRTLAAGLPFKWVVASHLPPGEVEETHAWLADHGLHHVLAVPDGFVFNARKDVATLAAQAPAARWRARGRNLWALVSSTTTSAEYLLVRRDVSTGHAQGYVCHAPTLTAFADLVTAAESAERITEQLEHAKRLVGLDHYQVRLYEAWYRHITLAMVAHACLTTTNARISWLRAIRSPRCRKAWWQTVRSPGAAAWTWSRSTAAWRPNWTLMHSPRHGGASSPGMTRCAHPFTGRPTNR
jgi:SRSO17 transposase